MSTFTLNAADTYSSRSTGLFTQFMQWCDKQEHNRLFWMGLALGAQGCVLLPLAMMSAILAHTNMVLLLMAFSAIVMTFITNLAALPTKITIPVFLLGVIIDVTVIVAAFALGMDFGRVFGA